MTKAQDAAEQATWEATSGLAPGTTKVTLTCDKQEREQWREEAVEYWYSSRSKYLYERVQEAGRATTGQPIISG